VIAGLYARKSSDDERSAEDGRSIDRQVALARAFAESKGWAVGESYTDDGISGANFERAGLVALLAGAKKKSFGAVVMMSLDRLGREQVDVGKTMQTLTRAGVQVWTYTDGQMVRFGRAVEKIMVGIGGFAAEAYREAVRDKVVEALRSKAERGHHVNGRTFGYDRVRVGDHTEKQINVEQAGVVKRIFEMSAEGLGDRRIATRLHEEGAPAPGGSWTKRPVRVILQNESYIGRAVYGKTVNVDDGGAGKRRHVERSSWITVEQPDLRIVSDDLWARVQARKAQTKSHYLRGERGQLLSKPEAGTVAKYMLSGIARCGVCGSTMTFIGGRTNRRYYCLGRAHKGPTFCSNKGGVPMDILDKAVIGVLLDELLSDRERLWSLIAEHDAKRQAKTIKRPDPTRAISKLQGEITKLVDALASGKGGASITAAIQERESKIALLKVEPAAEPMTKERFLAGYTGFRILINRRHPDQVRQLLRKLGCDRIVVTRTATGWDFAGEIDAGRIRATPPQEPDLIETDAAGYLINKGPSDSSGEIFSPVASSSTRGPDTAIEAPSSITTKSERHAFQVGSP